MAQVVINTNVKLGEGTLTEAAVLDIVADYVIDTGSNAYGYWEKWHSGKLVQTMTGTVLLHTSGWQYFPIPYHFVGAYSVEGSLTADPITGNAGDWWDNMHKFTFVRADVTRCAALIRNVNVVGSGRADVVATGRWK